jgi:hypothetical protein
MALYQLAAHVWACRTEDHVVLLDVARNRYIGIDERDSRRLQQMIAGWPVESMCGDAGDVPTDLVGEMLAHGIVTMRADERSSLSRRAVLEPAASALIDRYLDSQPAVQGIDVINFLQSVLVASFMLKRRSLSSVIARINARLTCSTARSAEIDLTTARNRVAVFMRLQPWILTAREACLFHSLALSEFLHHYGLAPHFVIGVSTGPFIAHCWLQQGRVVFNDTPERVRKFTPLLVL